MRSLALDAAAETPGWVARFAQVDLPASGAWTRRHLDRTPVGPDLLTDLRALDAAA